MKIFIMMSLILNPILLNASHPVLILMLIITQTFLICLLTWSLMKSSWMSFILFIIFLGGMMVLFVYITSLASNEKFEMKFNFYQNMTFYITALVFSAFLIKPMSSFLFPSTFNFFNSIFVMLSFSNLFIILLIMSYLLLTLIVAVKISNKFEGPLRNMN